MTGIAPEVRAALPVIDDTRVPLTTAQPVGHIAKRCLRTTPLPPSAPRDVGERNSCCGSGRRHPRDGTTEVTAYPNHLAVEREVSASTQNQALSALRRSLAICR